MKEYNSVSEPFLADVRAVVGDANVFTEPEKLEQYKTDEEYDPRRFRVPEAVVRPANAEEIAAVVKLCNKYNVPLTVRSGGTSLADGAIAVCGGIVLLMERLNKIIEMNTEAMYVVAEAGVRTVDIQKMANEAGYLYAGDPCSAESISARICAVSNTRTKPVHTLVSVASAHKSDFPKQKGKRNKKNITNE